MAGVLPGMLMSNSTAAGSITAAVFVAEGVWLAVPVAVAPELLEPVGVCVSGGVSVIVADGEPVGVSVRGAVRVRDVDGVPV